MKKYEPLEFLGMAAKIANNLRTLAIDSNETISITMGAGGETGSIVFFEGMEMVWDGDGWCVVNNRKEGN